jgi:biopolymer transport protein ExbB
MSLKHILRAPLLAAALCLSTLALHTAAFAQAASAPDASTAPAATPAPAAPPVVAPTITKETIIFTKLFEQRKLLKSAKAASANFWTSGSVKKGMETLDEGSAFRFIAEQGLKADEHHEGSLVEQIDRHTWITMSMQRAVDNISSRLQDGLAFLATVGSTAPFVGLFGTVWGIYHALTAIGIAGQASIDKVAGPVGEALIMTAFGLAVAVPAVMGYNWLIRRNKMVMERVRAFSGDLHNVLLAGKR